MKTWIVLLSLLLSLSANSTEKIIKLGPQKVGKSDSGIKFPKYKDIVAQMESLVRNYPSTSELIRLGKTNKKRIMTGVLLHKIGTPVKKLFVVTGATHGNEYLHIVDRLMFEFVNPAHQEFAEFFEKGGAFFVLPIFNPDGFAKRRRENAKRQDLNRDYDNIITGVTRFTQLETQNMKRWLDNFLGKTSAKFELSIDYHCCYRGSLLFPWGFTKDKIPNSDRQLYNEVGQMMQRHFDDNPEYGAVSEIIWYLADGTSHDYYYAKYGSLSMTYEGRYRSEKDMLSNHVAWWKDIVTRFGL